MNKAQIRKTMLAERNDLTSKYVNDCSDNVFELLTGMDELKNAKSVMIYSDFKNEVRTGKLAGWLLYYGKQVFLPVVDGEDLLVANMRSTRLEMNQYGITQPEKATASFVEPDVIDLYIVPGVAFDSHGNRIGFGKGYYDGLLAKAPIALKIGLSYEFQLLDKIDADVYDIKMDMVVTPKKIVKG